MLNKASCNQLIQISKSINHLKQIQTQMFILGLHQCRATLNKLMVFCTNPSLGDLHHAEKILTHIQSPGLFIYNVMIKAFSKRKRFKSVFELFRKMRKQGLLPDNFTYPFACKAIGGLGETLQGAGIHGFVVKNGFGFDSYVCNSLIDMYMELGQVDHAMKLFDEMPEKDVVSWNVVISGCGRCMRFREAVSVFRRMREENNVKPDEATVVSTLSACAALKDLEVGKEVHEYVRGELEFSSVIGNVVLDMYAKCGCLSEARKVFDELRVRNVMCWTSMVCGYVNCGMLDEARELFDRSPTKDVVLWTAMMNGYVQYNQFDEAVALFQEMQSRRVRVDKFTVVALLTGCAQLGALEQGKWIHGYIDETGIKIDAVVGTALIEMYAKCGCIDKSLEIFNALNEKDAASWTSMICALAMNGKTSKAVDLFSKMKQHRINPDDITFIGVLSACSHGGLVDKGRKLFHSMRKDYGIEPKPEHYGCLIDLLGRAGLLDEAEELIKSISRENSKIIVPLYSALLSACRIHGNVDMSERVAKRLSDIESSGSSSHTLLANIYADAERWEDVTKVRRKMRDLGVKKMPGCSSIEINGIIHEFLVSDSSHPHMEQIYSMLHRLKTPLLVSDEYKFYMF